MKYISTAFLLLILIINQSHGQKLYWSNIKDGRIYKSDLNGSNYFSIPTATSYSDIGTFGIDIKRSNIYFVGNTKMQKIDSNGNLLDEFSIYKPSALVVNQASGQLFWIDKQDSSIYKLVLESNLTSKVKRLLFLNPTIIATDEINGKIYFADPIERKVYKMDLDGNNVVNILSIYRPKALAVDGYHNKIYWTEITDEKIYSANTDGSNLMYISNAYSNLQGIAYDPIYNKIYFSDIVNEKIYKMNPDGTNPEVILSGFQAKSISIEPEKTTISVSTIGGSPFHLSATSELLIQLNFTVSGLYFADNTFKAELSDVNGSFTNPILVGSIKSAQSGKIIIKVPSNTLSGNKYVIRISSTNPSVTSNSSNSIELVSNLSPSFYSNPGLEAEPGQLYSYTIIARDSNNDPITVSAKILPTWLKFNIYDSSFVKTLAGSTYRGFEDGISSNARFNSPGGTAIDGAGNVYVADIDNHRIRKIAIDGSVSTIAGDGYAAYKNGNGISAEFSSPTALVIDINGNIYVTDKDNNVIRKISSSGLVTTFAGTGNAGFIDGILSSAEFSSPEGIAIDQAGNLYISDAGNNAIRKITGDGQVTTLAGGSNFSSPKGIALDKNGNVYVADYNNHQIKKITPYGEVTILAGTGEDGFNDGIGLVAKFSYPSGVAIDKNDYVYVSDYNNHRLRQISVTGEVITISGNGTPSLSDTIASSSKYNFPSNISIDCLGDLYITDKSNNSIRKMTRFITKITGTPNKSDIGLQPVKLSATDGVSFTDQVFNITVKTAKPVISSKNLVFSNFNSTSLTLNWEKGDGESRIVVASEDKPVIYVPIDKVPSSGVNNDFSMALPKTDQNRIVYNGNSNSFNVKGLTPGKTYYFAVYEYNGTDTFSMYLTSNPALAHQTTNKIILNDLSAQQYTVTGTTPAVFNISTTVLGTFSSNNVFFAYLSDALGDFSKEQMIGSSLSSGSTTITVTIPIGTMIGTDYKIRVKSNNPGITSNASSAFQLSSEVRPYVTFDLKGPVNSSPIKAKIVFSDIITGFDVQDIEVYNGTPGNLQTIKPDQEFTIDITPNQSDVSVYVRILGGGVQNLSGQTNISSELKSIYYDISKPKPVISSNEPNPTNKKQFDIRILFNENVDTLRLTDFILQSCQLINPKIVRPGTEWTATAIASGGSNISIFLPQGCSKDAAGNTNLASEIFKINYDVIRPNATITSYAYKYTNADTFSVNIEFDKKVTGFGQNDLVLFNCALLNFKLVKDSLKWTATFRPIEGKVKIELSENVAVDVAGNWNIASSFSIICDRNQPIPKFSSLEPNPTNNNLIKVTLNFNKGVKNFDILSLPISQNAKIIDYFNTLPGRQWIIYINAKNEGEVILAINKSITTDSAGNYNVEAPAFKVRYDNISPNIKITCLDKSPTNKAPVRVKINFSEGVKNFSLEKIKVTRGTPQDLTIEPDAMTWFVNIMPNEPGDIKVEIPSYSVSDTAGNLNTDSPSLRFNYDIDGPVVDIISLEKSDTTNLKLIKMKIKFREAINAKEFSQSDIVIKNAKLQNLNAIDSAYEWTFELVPVSPGIITVDVPKESFTDLAGNYNYSAFTKKIAYNNIKPKVSITYKGTGSTKYLISCIFAFSKPVVDFNLQSVTTTSINYKANYYLLNDSTYVLEFKPYANVTALFSIAADKVHDFAGNGNEASSIYQIKFGSDIIAPTASFECAYKDTVNDKFNLKIIFSDPIKISDKENFNIDSIKVENATLDNFRTEKTAQIFSVDVSPIKDGLVKVTIPANAVHEYSSFGEAGNFGNVDTSFRIIYIRQEVNFKLTGNNNMDENNAIGQVVGEFEMNPPYKTSDYNFVFVPQGNNHTDNDLFTFQGNKLLTAAVFNFENRSSVTIYVKAIGPKDTPTKPFKISILDIPEKPRYMNEIRDTSVMKGNKLSYAITNNAFDDEDANDKLTYSGFLKVDGILRPLPVWLKIDVNNLIIYCEPSVPDTAKAKDYVISITATDKTGLTAIVDFTLTIVPKVSIKGIDISDVLILYPNPSDGLINLKIPVSLLNSEVSIIDQRGKCIINNKLNSNIQFIDLKHYAKGIYYLKVKNNKQLIVKKLIIK